MSRGAKITIGILAGVVLIALIALAVWWFQPAPAISVQVVASPQSRSGVLIQVTGTHFPANREIYVGLTVPGAPPTVGTTFASVMTGGDGSFVAPFPFPNDPSWLNLPNVTVYAGTPEGDAVATTRLSISSIAALVNIPSTGVPASATPAPAPSATPAPGTPTATGVPVPMISLQPPSGQVGTTIQVTGRGWRPNDVVSLFLAAPQGLRLVGATNVDAQGNFTAVFVFPTDWGGPAVTTVVVRNSDGNLQASSIFQVLNLVPPTPRPVIPTPTPVVIFNWKGEYYNNPALAGSPAFIRDDTSIDFDWGSIAPGSGVPNEHWSARWTRRLHMSAANYRFFATADDGVRVWFDNRLIIDQWHPATGIQYQADVPYVPNGDHSIRVEFYQDTGPAYMHFWWQEYVLPTATASPTPTNTFTPTSAPTSTNTPPSTNTPTATHAPTSTSTPTVTNTPAATSTPTPTATP